VVRGRGAGDDVQSLTSARRPHSEDQRARQRRYLISMVIRTVCFALAIFVDGPWRWVFIAAAVFLPYVAVVFANAGRETAGPGPVAPPAAPMGAIGPGRPGPPQDPRRDA
jgi:hypothetical protein